MRAAWGGVGLALLLAGGCAAPVVVVTAGLGALQAGTASFIHGELESAQVSPLETVDRAAALALGDLQFEIISQRHTNTSASYHARETHGRSITIDLSAKSPVVTKTNIRVGFMGDQVMSRLILEEIQARCPAIPAAQPAEGDSTP